MDDLQLCEACRLTAEETIIENDDARWPYRLCFACARRLVTLSLRPLEWFRLAAIHGPSQHYLHDDFYSQSGEAFQAKEEVREPEKWPLPELSGATLATLIDYVIICSPLGKHDAVLDCLKLYDVALLLIELQHRVNLPSPVEIEACLYRLCAGTVGLQAEAWIRICWKTYQPQAFSALAFASSRCLPSPEGFEHVQKELDTSFPHEARLACQVLSYFATETALDWIETHIQLPVMYYWGSLAAVSGFSWEKATRWLEAGRPLSLVALDALEISLLRQMQNSVDISAFWGEISRNDVKATLETYLRQDSAPRVKQVIARLVQHISM